MNRQELFSGVGHKCIGLETYKEVRRYSVMHMSEEMCKAIDMEETYKEVIECV